MHGLAATTFSRVQGWEEHLVYQNLLVALPVSSLVRLYKISFCRPSSFVLDTWAFVVVLTPCRIQYGEGRLKTCAQDASGPKVLRQCRAEVAMGSCGPSLILRPASGWNQNLCWKASTESLNSKLRRCLCPCLLPAEVSGPRPNSQHLSGRTRNRRFPSLSPMASFNDSFDTIDVSSGEASGCFLRASVEPRSPVLARGNIPDWLPGHPQSGDREVPSASSLWSLLRGQARAAAKRQFRCPVRASSGCI